MIAKPSKKRSVIINGKKTSVSLEDEFWHALNMISIARGMTIRGIVSQLETDRNSTNLSSSIRIAVLSHYQSLASGMPLPARAESSGAVIAFPQSTQGRRRTA